MSHGAPYPVGLRVIAAEPFSDIDMSPATVVTCERVGDTETWAVTREHDSGPRVTTLWPGERLLPVQGLTSAQLDGQGCLICGDDSGPMRPVSRIDGCQVFAHERCRRR